VEFRQLPSPAPTLAQGCSAVLGAGTSFTVPITPINAVGGSALYGCSASGTLGSITCPHGFLGNFIGANLQSFTLGSVCGSSAVLTRVLFSAAGAVTACGDAATCGVAPYAAGVGLYGSGGASQTGCMAAGSTACPTGFNFAVWVTPASGQSPSLSQW
jgi:hypothetical protein